VALASDNRVADGALDELVDPDCLVGSVGSVVDEAEAVQHAQSSLDVALGSGFTAH
jgi:hypothetical protein